MNIKITLYLAALLCMVGLMHAAPDMTTINVPGVRLPNGQQAEDTKIEFDLNDPEMYSQSTYNELIAEQNECNGAFILAMITTPRDIHYFDAYPLNEALFGANYEHTDGMGPRDEIYGRRPWQDPLNRAPIGQNSIKYFAYDDPDNGFDFLFSQHDLLHGPQKGYWQKMIKANNCTVPKNERFRAKLDSGRDYRDHAGRFGENAINSLEQIINEPDIDVQLKESALDYLQRTNINKMSSLSALFRIYSNNNVYKDWAKAVTTYNAIDTAMATMNLPNEAWAMQDLTALNIADMYRQGGHGIVKNNLNAKRYIYKAMRHGDMWQKSATEKLQEIDREESAAAVPSAPRR